MFLNDLGVYSFVDYEDCPDITTEIKSLTFGGPHAVIVDSISDTLLQFAIRVRVKGIMDMMIGSRLIFPSLVCSSATTYMFVYI